MEILNQFGINPLLLAAQVVNFLILLFILKKFMYKPLLGVLETRKKRIEESLKNAEEIEKKLLQTQKDKEKILAEAVREAQKVIDEGKASVAQMMEEGRQKAAKEVALILKRGKETLQLEREKMQAEIRTELSELVVAVFSKVTGKILIQKDQKELVNKAIKEL